MSDNNYTKFMDKKLGLSNGSTITGKQAATGLTKREIFAMNALQGLLARGTSQDPAVAAVHYADLLIEELNKKAQP